MIAGQEKLSLAKITAPKAHNIVLRKRLFALLDRAVDKKHVTWISAPAGSGKTTLISSYLHERKLRCLWYRCDEGDTDLPTFFYYMAMAAKKANPRKAKPLPLLTPEYLLGVPTFTRRFFEELYSRLKPPFIVVLDNYQEIPAGSQFHEMLVQGIDVIPAGIHMAIISRHEPPPQFARLSANNRMGLIGWEDVRFTVGETTDLINAGMRNNLPRKSVMEVYKKADGWVAAIVLMLERARQRGARDAFTEEFASEKIFDYFTEEIFGKTGEDVQHFLLKTAFLPAVNVPLAERLTGLNNADGILSALNRHNFFTERLSGGGQDYQYHPLFRDFLLNRAKTELTLDELAATRTEAALLLEQSGQIEEAARLYRDAGDGEGLSRMVIHHAPGLLRQGRNKTVTEWLLGIPGETADNNPWLLYWNGMCSYPFDMTRTRRYLEKAFDSFKAQGDATGVYLSWAGIVDTHALGLDEWKRLDGCIAAFDDIRRRYPDFPSKETELIASSRMLIALTMRKTDQPELVHGWLERVSALLRENPSLEIQMDTVFYMSVYYLWKGEYKKNAVLLDRAEADIRYHKPTPFAAIRIKFMKGIHYWVTAQYDSALNTLNEGLDISGRSGVHVFDFLLWDFKAAAAMAFGNREIVDESLDRMTSLLYAAKTLDVFFYHISFAWHAILNGNIAAAAENMETISQKVAKIGAPYYRALWHIGMAQAAFLQGHARDAKTHIRTALKISLGMKSHVLEWSSLLSEAYFLLQEGSERQGLLSLERGLLLGRKYGYALLEFYQPEVMKVLCAKALEAGIEEEYVKGLIRKLGLTPPSSDNPSSLLPLDKGRMGGVIFLDNWPYPIKIRTLGGFEIIKDGKQLSFSGKAPKKPLELLKAVIAFGGKNVSVDKLTNALWPDVDGDAAYSSFKVNLHNLRKLLGRDDVIMTSEARISLNFNYCHVDVPAFQNLMDSLMEMTEAGKTVTEKMLPLGEKAIKMYHGNFLEDEEGYPHIASLRERLRSRFVRLVEITGRCYESGRQWHRAVELYEKGIEIDEFQEEFYRYIMLCYKKLGKRRDAAAVYDRCLSMLKNRFNVEPSAETKAVYESLIAR